MRRMPSDSIFRKHALFCPGSRVWEARSSTKRYPDLRRLYLSRVRYHIYYRLEPGKVLVLAFWHASRGGGPGL